MSQAEVEKHLKQNEGAKLTADELKVRLDLGASIYTNLKNLRKQSVCESCKWPVRHEGAHCVYCGWKLNSMVRCALLEASKDRRNSVFVYWCQG